MFVEIRKSTQMRIVIKLGSMPVKTVLQLQLRKFKSDFSKLDESTVHDFKRKYEEKLKISKIKGENISTSVTEKRGRPHF